MCFVEESQKTLINMENVLIPLNAHYGSIITQCNNLNKAFMYRRALRSTRFALLDLLNMFRYNKNDNFYYPAFYKSVQRQLLDVEKYIKEVDELIKEMKSN